MIAQKIDEKFSNLISPHSYLTCTISYYCLWFIECDKPLNISSIGSFYEIFLKIIWFFRWFIHYFVTQITCSRLTPR